MTTTVVYPSYDLQALCGTNILGESYAQDTLDGIGTSEVINDTTTTARIRTYRYFGSDFYRVGQSYLEFDTSSIGTGQVVNDATFSFAISGSGSPSSFTLEVYGMPVGSAWDDYWIDQSEMAATGRMATHDLPTYNTANTIYTMVTYDLAKARASVDPIGTSCYSVISSLNRTLDGASFLLEPYTEKYVTMYQMDYTGTTYDPYLTVTHAAYVGGEDNTVVFGCNF
jgi:hypothetical protein